MRLYGWVFGAVFGIFAVSATFCQVFSGFLLGLGAVLVISAVSATFCRVLSGFWAGFGVLFW